MALSGLPFGVAVSVNDVAYITQLLNATAVRAQLPDTTLSAPFDVGPLPSQVRMSPDGQTAYVENQDNSTITYIDVDTNTAFATVTTPGGSILNMGLSPDGTRIYALTDFSGVYVIDVAARAVIAQIPVSETGSLLTGVAFHPFAPCMYIAARDEGAVRTVDLGSNAVVFTRNGPGRIQGLTVSLDGGSLYGTAIDLGQVVSWDLPSNSSSFDATTTGAGAFDVAVTPDNAQLFVSNLFNGDVSVLDRATRSLVGTIPTGGGPRYIGFSASGGQAVIANESGWINFVR